MKPAAIFSLDLELLCQYGLYPKHERIGMLHNKVYEVRSTMNNLLKIFEKYNIPATWAITGHVFLDHCEKENGIPHKHMPRFKDDWYSWDPCSNISKDPLYYGKDIVEKIISSRVKHDIGYHSFSHVRFSECSREVAEAEIQEGLMLGKEFGLNFKSFVFPENKIGHIDILKQKGFEIYRGPNLAGKSINKNIALRAINFFSTKVVAPSVVPIWKDGIWEIPSSMMFYDSLFPYTLVLRAKLGVQNSIKYGRIFHMFMHPEDFVIDASLLGKLEQVLEFVSQKKDEKNIEVITMRDLAFILNKKL